MKIMYNNRKFIILVKFFTFNEIYWSVLPTFLFLDCYFSIFNPLMFVHINAILQNTHKYEKSKYEKMMNVVVTIQ